MRGIKFRAWHKPTQLMDDVALIDFYNEKIGILYADPVMQCESMQKFNFNEVEIMQYTGLEDKNGQEIYEGDILLGHCVYPEHSIFECKLTGEVYYTSRGTWDCYSYILGGFNEQVEVIGNIYENPELLEVEE